jgi:anti-sigma factor (TIGR02949 family)
MAHDENCRDFLDLLSDYVDGDLQEDLCADIEQHMRDCENCRIVIDTLRKTVYLYRSTSELTSVPVNVRQRLFHRLDLDDYLNR